MSLDNNSANNFKDFLEAIKPYLNYQLYDCSGMGIDAFHFSATEKPVGQWTDGKLIYAKTISCNTPSSAGVDTKIADCPANTDQIIFITGHIMNLLPLNYYDTANWCVHTSAHPTNGIVQTIKGSSWLNVSEHITIFYTKTTDSPLANDEKFAGVTNDGEVIYQKTLTNISWAVPANAWGHYSHGISNVKRIVNAEVFFGENLAKYGALGIGGGTDGKVDICGNADARTMSLAILKYIKTS